MRAAVYRGGGRLVAEDWPTPAIGAGEILLRLKGCGLCGSDIAKIVDPATRVPAVFGHEVVGAARLLKSQIPKPALRPSFKLRLRIRGFTRL